MKKNNAFTVNINNDNSSTLTKLSLYEIRRLAFTAGYNVIEEIVLKIKKIASSSYISQSKLNNISSKATLANIEVLIFNFDLSPTQIRNIQKVTKKVKVLDRTALILEIFKRNAKTKESKLQVELAEMQYMLPRLAGQWTHLERQVGGVGVRGGPGEKQIEIDRRLLRRKITKYKLDLKKIDTQRNTRLSSRNNFFNVALVGYTNAGKSSILNLLTGANLLTQDRLFATLDTSTKVMKYNLKDKILISDTVGFIQDLPHHLIASFKSTLNEISNANLIIKVIDSSSLFIDVHLKTIDEALKSIDLNKIPFFIIFNKVDLITSASKINTLKKTYKNGIFVSTLKRIQTDKIIKEILKYYNKNRIRKVIHIDFENLDLLQTVYKFFDVIYQENQDKGIYLEIEGEKKNFKRFNL